MNIKMTIETKKKFIIISLIAIVAFLVLVKTTGNIQKALFKKKPEAAGKAVGVTFEEEAVPVKAYKVKMTDFKDTLDMMKKIKFDSAYIYKYSARPPAKSSEFAEAVPEEDKKKRHAVLLEMQKEISKEKSAARKGRALPMA